MFIFIAAQQRGHPYVWSADLFGQVLQDRNRDHDIEGLGRRCSEGKRCYEQAIADEEGPEKKYGSNT
jgi:hypothetical protein